MAVLTVKKNQEFADFTPGWKIVTVVGATRGKYDGGQGKKYLDLHFEGYPETVKLRLHQKFNKTTGEEFNIANAFRYANAGISDASEGETEVRVEINTEPEHIIGKKLQVYFYKNAKGYTDISDNVVPAEPFENIVEKFDEGRIKSFRDYTYNNRIKPYISTFTSNQDDWDKTADNSDDEGWTD